METDGKARRARYIMVGGFLGAGKTTAIVQLGKYLSAHGKRVGLITNDQSFDLVDTRRIRAAGFPVEEITGGCFCCKFDSLVDASRKLSQSDAPEVFIAEPVGSCTDLKATVSYPLSQLYGNDYSVAPLSVLVDPTRCARVLGLMRTGQEFSSKVTYVYRKQLEEAEVLVINKIDTIDTAFRGSLAAALKEQYPQAQVLEVSSQTGESLEVWFERIISGDLANQPTMDVDYDEYAEGEALLGWLNSRVALNSASEFDGNAFLISLATNLRDELAAQNIQIAHLKLTLAPDEGPDLGAVGLTRTEGRPQATHTLSSGIQRGELVVNLRAEADPEVLKTTVNSAMDAITTAHAHVLECAAFRPGRPTPTHRIAVPRS